MWHKEMTSQLANQLSIKLVETVNPIPESRNLNYQRHTIQLKLSRHTPLFVSVTGAITIRVKFIVFLWLKASLLNQCLNNMNFLDSQSRCNCGISSWSEQGRFRIQWRSRDQWCFSRPVTGQLLAGTTAAQLAPDSSSLPVVSQLSRCHHVLVGAPPQFQASTCSFLCCHTW